MVKRLSTRTPRVAHGATGSNTRSRSRPPTAGPTNRQRQHIARHNADEAKFEPVPVAPTGFKVKDLYSQLEPAGFLLMSADGSYGTTKAKDTIAQNLPEDVTLVVYVRSDRDIEAARQHYLKLRPPERLEVIALSGAGFWARDGIPQAVRIEHDDGRAGWALVGAKYYHGWEPDKQVASKFGLPLVEHEYYYEGGNCVPVKPLDGQDCLAIVNAKGSDKIPDALFQELYGQEHVERLPHLAGIGHCDEHLVEVVLDQEVITDLPEYATILREKLKYPEDAVHVISRPQGGAYRTHANALIVNGVAFVPVYNEPSDKAAVEAFTKAGLKVVEIDGKSSSDQGHGGVHCYTMSFPKMDKQALLAGLRAAVEPESAPVVPILET